MSIGLRAKQSSRSDVQIEPFTGPLGAFVDAGDLRHIDVTAEEAIRRAWAEHLVLVFRDQTLTDADLVTFAKRFGILSSATLVPSPLAVAGKVKQGGKIDSHPEVSVVSNVVENGIAIGGLGDGDLMWHSDRSSHPRPPAGTFLYALETPEHQGATEFANLHLALDLLPQSLRTRIDRLDLKHDGAVDAAGYVRAGSQPNAEDLRNSPGYAHPIITTHPETGYDSLFLGRRVRAYIVGLEPQDSEDLLDELWEHATRPQLRWAHDWKPGDLVLWDNRNTLHRRDAFDPDARRIMHRVMTEGAVPFRAKTAAGQHPRGHR